MISASRADTSTLGRWWWTVDRWTLAALLLLIGFGYVMMLATAVRGASDAPLLLRQVTFLAAAGVILIGVSAASPQQVRWMAWAGLALALAAVALTLVAGVQDKGARRWLAVPGLGTGQPSELLKPCLAVISGWLLAEAKLNRRLLPLLGVLGLIGLAGVLLLLQPDFGMLMVVGAVFVAQLFISGISLVLVALLGAGLVAALILGWLFLPHVRSRIERFWNPEAGDNFQVERSLQAFGHGGLLGRGPGEGHLKTSLPDARNDFVLAVIGEEYGLVACLLVLALFAFIVVRGLFRLLDEREPFVALAAAGLLTQFGLQAFVNMASTLGSIPTKGMTLPFVSHGGSSILGIALGMGMLLALTRRRPGRQGT